MTKVILMTAEGHAHGELPQTVEEILLRAEEHAREHRLAKLSYFPVAVRNEIAAAGFQVTDADLAATMTQLESVRRGERIDRVSVRVTPSGRRGRALSKENDLKPPVNSNPSGRFFERERTYPDVDARAWYDRLIGLDEQKRRLVLELELLLYPERLLKWSRKHHGAELRACQFMACRAPLILLEGDVGCGKTALAETVGDPLAARNDSKVHLLKVNTQVRGTGMVGEMTDLIVQAFSLAEARADSLGDEPLLLLIDEADALAAKRVDQHMHHEDKAGLNTLLQRIDGLRLGKRRIAVIFVTNRPDALDPAVRRRAALRLTFRRPSDEVRTEIFRQALVELNPSDEQLRELVAATGERARASYGASFTASDITDRLLPAAVSEAYEASRPLRVLDVCQHAHKMEPTPLMEESDKSAV